MTSGFAKIIFDLERDPEEPSFPPISAESLNAKAVVNDSEFLIDNTPFFVTGVALGDRVAASPIPNAQGKYRFLEILDESGAKSLSIIFLTLGIEESVGQELRRRGCYCEYGEFGELKMLAVSVPETCDYDELRNFLVECEEIGSLSFAELAI